MLNPFLHGFFGGFVICRQTSNAQMTGGAAVNHFLMQTDLVICQISAALLTMIFIIRNGGVNGVVRHGELPFFQCSAEDTAVMGSYGNIHVFSQQTHVLAGENIP